MMSMRIQAAAIHFGCNEGLPVWTVARLRSADHKRQAGPLEKAPEGAPSVLWVAPQGRQCDCNGDSTRFQLVVDPLFALFLDAVEPQEQGV